MGKSAATKQLDQAQDDKSKYLGQIEDFQYGEQRQGLDNPYGETTNAFAGLTNPFANQRVATGAAEFQAQRFDQNLANILDSSVQAGGGSGVSATALAQQAQLSNQQISAGLQQQEANIQSQSAQGEAQRQQLVAQGEARRQELFGAGEQYILGLSEQRDVGELQGLGNLYAGAQQSENAALEAKAASKAAIFGAIGQIGGAVVGAAAGNPGGFGGVFKNLLG